MYIQVSRYVLDMHDDNEIHMTVSSVHINIHIYSAYNYGLHDVMTRIEECCVMILYFI